MPKQVSGVEVTDNGDGTVNVQVGAFGYTVERAALFDRSPDARQILDSIRLFALVGGYGSLASREMVDAINVRGIRCGDKDRFLHSIDLNADGTYTINLSSKRNDTQFSLVVDPEALSSDDKDPGVVLRNLVPFLRIDAHDDLTPSAVAAIRSARFWI